MMVRKGAAALGLAAVAVAIIAAISALEGSFSPFTFFGNHHGAQSLLVSGNIEAHESVLSFKTVQSRIEKLPFDEGQWVTKGTLLAQLDDSDYRQSVAQDQAALEQREQEVEAAEANLEAARKILLIDQADLQQKSIDFKRNQEMWKGGATSTQIRDLAETALKQSRAANLRDKALESSAEKNVASARAAVKTARESLKLAQIILGYTVLAAPFDGVILTRQAELGEVMLPGAPVVTLADLDHVWLRAYVNETNIGMVRYGQTAIITTDTYPGKQYQGRISAIASKAEFTPKSVETHAERVTLVYRVKIDVHNPTHELVPGLPADAHILFSSDQTSQ